MVTWEKWVDHTGINCFLWHLKKNKKSWIPMVVQNTPTIFICSLYYVQPILKNVIKICLSIILLADKLKQINADDHKTFVGEDDKYLHCREGESLKYDISCVFFYCWYMMIFSTFNLMVTDGIILHQGTWLSPSHYMNPCWLKGKWVLGHSLRATSK